VAPWPRWDGTERRDTGTCWARSPAEVSGWGEDQARSEVVEIHEALRSSALDWWESQAGIQLG